MRSQTDDSNKRVTVNRGFTVPTQKTRCGKVIFLYWNFGCTVNTAEGSVGKSLGNIRMLYLIHAACTSDKTKYVQRVICVPCDSLCCTQPLVMCAAQVCGATLSVIL